MPHRTTSSPIRARRVLAAAGVVVLAVALIWAPRAGRSLVHDDPLERADAIFVLGGKPAEHLVEAGDLLVADWAPRILISGEIPDGGELELARRGIRVPTRPERCRDLLVAMGVPANAIELLPQAHDSTYDEGVTLASLVRARHWSRVIVVTSKMHTRRAALVMRRALAGTNAAVVVHAARLDRADPDHWWRSRSDRRFVFIEWQKLIYYWLRAR